MSANEVNAVPHNPTAPAERLDTEARADAVGITPLDLALTYAEIDQWAVIPIAPRGKTPLVSWQCYQRQRADAATGGEWFTRWPAANIGVVTGPVSGIVVVDLASHKALRNSSAGAAAGSLPRPW